jgi:N-acetylmuramoyl-L-alanine amidase
MGSRRRRLLDKNAGVYRFDQLYVLRASQTPAVLLEAGNIKNRDEEVLLGTPEHRALIARAAVAAVEKFCALRKPRKPAAMNVARKR